MNTCHTFAVMLGVMLTAADGNTITVAYDQPAFLSDGSNVLVEYAYDPWGRLCDPATLKPYGQGEEPEILFGRGFTGHEHLPWFGLINMNARLYDPLCARFLSPDPFVQAPYFSQSFNRYSYCLNNPLVYVDESGEVWWVPVIGAIAGGYGGYKLAKAMGVTGWNAVLYVAEGAALGAASIYLGLAVSTAVIDYLAIGGIAGGTVSGATSALVSSFVNDFGFGLMSGKDPAAAFVGAIKPALKSALLGGAVGGVIGGVDAAVNNQNIWNGKARIPATEDPLTPITSEEEMQEVMNARFEEGIENLQTKISFERPSINGYHPSLERKTDLYHNFPTIYDEIIINYGNAMQRLSDRAYIFEHIGYINGVEGIFQMGIRSCLNLFTKFCYESFWRICPLSSVR